MVRWESAHQMALSLPEAEERDHFGSPSFRVRGKIFAQLSKKESNERRALVKLSAADQSALLMSDPEIFSSVPGWGHHGWTYIQLASIDRTLLRALLFRSWRQVAPKRLAADHADLR